MALTIAVLLIGSILGLCFEVLILIPAILLTMVVIGIGGLTYGLSVGWTLLAVAEAALALQMGYLGGAFISVARLKIIPEMQHSTSLRA
jgi:hypothetical protein